ncbi:MAG: sigma-70 family RNA polymerase sigma factor [Phycisphaerales bacterium]|nr:sigma-70 family RNA polymerase sigma factor [Phycisphaerales bacterium]
MESPKDNSGGDQVRPIAYSHELFETVSDELRRLATVVFNDSSGQKTLQPTVLVNEAWIKLAGKLDGINDRHHFFALAAQVMRQVLADYARGQSRAKRGGGRKRLTLGPGSMADAVSSFDMIEFNDALEHLASLNRRHAQVAELRLLGAMSVDEIADQLGIGEATVKRDWQMAKLWLMRELS